MRREPPLRPLLGFDPAVMPDDMALIAEVLARAVPDDGARGQIRELAAQHFGDPALAATLLEDVAVTALRDGAPGGEIMTLLFGNGLHTVLGHRLAHAVFHDGRPATALALKDQFLRAFGADILPDAQFGRRIWIDHGVGIVIGQTAILEDDVNMWHGVTLGTDLVARGPGRHPRLRRGCIIGAHAQIIGPIEIGEGAVVAAGAVVTDSVPPRSIAVGAKGRMLEGRARPAADFGIRLGELT